MHWRHHETRVCDNDARVRLEWFLRTSPFLPWKVCQALHQRCLQSAISRPRSHVVEGPPVSDWRRCPERLFYSLLHHRERSESLPRLVWTVGWWHHSLQGLWAIFVKGGTKEDGSNHFALFTLWFSYYAERETHSSNFAQPDQFRSSCEGEICHSNSKCSCWLFFLYISWIYTYFCFCK